MIDAPLKQALFEWRLNFNYIYKGFKRPLGKKPHGLTYTWFMICLENAYYDITR